MTQSSKTAQKPLDLEFIRKQADSYNAAKHSKEAQFAAEQVMAMLDAIIAELIKASKRK